MICKVKDCLRKKHARGFCHHHYRKWFLGKLDDDGNEANIIGKYKPKKLYVCKYPLCEKKGNGYFGFRNGFCSKHSKWHIKGFLDIEGNLLKEAPNERSYFHCKMEGCIKKHKAKGFCANHYRSYLIYNTIDIDGNRLGGKRVYNIFSKCLVTGCMTKGPFVKGFCKPHWTHYHKGFIDQDGKDLNIKETPEKKNIRMKFQNEKRRLRLTYKGETKSVNEWSELLGISAGALKERHYKGWVPDKLFSKKEFRKCQQSTSGMSG